MHNKSLSALPVNEDKKDASTCRCWRESNPIFSRAVAVQYGRHVHRLLAAQVAFLFLVVGISNDSLSNESSVVTG